MTFLTGTQAEVLYCMPAAGAALGTSITQTVISGNTSTNPPYQLPALMNLFGSPSYGYAGRALRVVARGTYGCTVSTPTLTVVAGLNTTQGTASPAIVLAATGAITLPASAITSGNWELEFGIDINSLGITTSSLDAIGRFSLGAGNNAATAAATVYMVGSAAAITTVNPQTAYWFEVAAKWGTSSASNTIQCLQFEVLGLN